MYADKTKVKENILNIRCSVCFKGIEANKERAFTLLEFPLLKYQKWNLRLPEPHS